MFRQTQSDTRGDTRDYSVFTSEDQSKNKNERDEHPGPGHGPERVVVQNKSRHVPEENICRQANYCVPNSDIPICT